MLERGEEGVLDRLFGAIEIAEDAGQNGDRPPRLASEQAVDVDVLRAGQDAEACAPPVWAMIAS